MGYSEGNYTQPFPSSGHFPRFHSLTSVADEFSVKSSQEERSSSSSDSISDQAIQKRRRDYLQRLLGERKLRGIVRITDDRKYRDPFMPWMTVEEKNGQSTAFVIGDGLILTCAHCVERSYSISVYKLDSTKRYDGKLLHIAPDSDLALIQVLEDEFMSDVEPLRLLGESEIKTLKKSDFVSIAGYPNGSKELITVFGEVEGTNLSYNALSPDELFSISTNAVAEKGHSGGPTLNKNGDVIGVQFSKTYHMDYIETSVIPSFTIVQQFLEDIRIHGEVTGMPDCGFGWEPSSRWDPGVEVQEVYRWSPVYGRLQAGDIVRRINNIKISRHGIVENTVGLIDAPGKSLDECISDMFVRSRAVLDVLRESKENGVTSFKVIYDLPNNREQFLCFSGGNEVNEDYYIYGNFCFTVFSMFHVIDESSKFHPFERLMTMAEQIRNNGDTEEIVLMTEMRNGILDTGFEESTFRVYAVNDQRVVNFDDLKDLIDSATETDISFTIGRDTSETRVIWLNQANALAQTQSTMETYDAISSCNDVQMDVD